MIFLDVGAHEGQTLEEVVKPRYGFDLIYAFEPMPQQFEVLEKRFGSHPKVRVQNYGLADTTGERTLYGDNAGMEASLYPEKRDVDEATATTCYFIAARAVLAHVPMGDLIVKLNCEGAEVPILDDLLGSGLIWRCTNVMIDFDILKVPGREAEAERILDRLDEAGFEKYSLAEEVMVGATHQARIRNWLDGVLPSRS